MAQCSHCLSRACVHLLLLLLHLLMPRLPLIMWKPPALHSTPSQRQLMLARSYEIWGKRVQRILMSFDDCANFFQRESWRLFWTFSEHFHQRCGAIQGMRLNVALCTLPSPTRFNPTQTENLGIASIHPMSGGSIATFLFQPIHLYLHNQTISNICAQKYK